MKKLLLALTGLLPLIASPASAQEDRWPHWYVGLSGDLTYMEDSDISPGNREYEFDTGWGFNAALGYLPNFSAPFLNNTRYELEWSYRENDLDRLSVGATNVSPGGDIQTMAYMANAYYDYDLGNGWKPYAGLGIGVAQVELESNSALLSVNDEDSVFAYQGMLGVAYAPQSLPMTEWLLGYRYFATQDPEFGTTTIGRVETDLVTHNLEVGARFKF